MAGYRGRWERNWRGEEQMPNLNYNAAYPGLEQDVQSPMHGWRGNEGMRSGPERGQRRRYDTGFRGSRVRSRVRFVPGGRRGDYGRDFEQRFGGGRESPRGYDLEIRIRPRAGGRGMSRRYDRGW